MKVVERLELLRTEMKKEGLDAYIVPTSDPHQSEYLSDYYKTREFISGFTGSAGTVVVTQEQAILWTDGRYFLQAEKQLAGSSFELYRMGEQGVPTVNQYLKDSLKEDACIGFDGMVFSVSLYVDIKESLPSSIRFKSDNDLIAKVWKDRPELVLEKAFVFDEKYTGKSAKEKIAEVRSFFIKKEVEATVIGALEDICWLFNIRGRDVACNPVVMSYAIITKEEASLFINKKQVSDEVKAYLTSQGVSLFSYEEVFTHAQKLTGVVYIDASRCNVALFNTISAVMVKGVNFTTRLKAVKNNTELENFRKAMVIDGVAMVKILKWVEDNVSAGVNECDVADALCAFRAEDESFIEKSFDTIAGYGSNGAIIHYSPERESAATLEPKGFLLLDSGGHYLYGTTDITRTIPLGPLSEQEKEDYTFVLKSHIQLALAKYKAGITGYQLDTLAREPLWRLGKDYKHGTGHGVGFVLSVHEGPQSISFKPNDIGFEVGMVTSNEPGLYITGSHGIRIENLVVTMPFTKNDFGEFYQFETITLCPIDVRPIKKELLLQEELDWLNAYHVQVEKTLFPLLDEVHGAFLKRLTKPF